MLWNLANTCQLGVSCIHPTSTCTVQVCTVHDVLLFVVMYVCHTPLAGRGWWPEQLVHGGREL